MELLNGGKIQADKMISAQYPVESIQEAFNKTLINGQDFIETLMIII